MENSSFGNCFIINKAGLHNMPQCKAEQSMLKVVAPTFKCDRTVHICLIEDVFDKLNHIFKELHGTHYVFILSGKKKTGLNSAYLQGKVQ